MGYVKRNAIAGRRFESFATLEAHLEAWIREIADTRTHGAICEPPCLRFSRDEAHRLKLLDGLPAFLTSRNLVRQVFSDCAVEVDGNTYSVPWRLSESGSAFWSPARNCRQPCRSGSRVPSTETGAPCPDRTHFEGITGGLLARAATQPEPEAAAVAVAPELLRPLSEYEVVAGGAW